MSVREMEMGDSHYKDFQGDDFKKMGGLWLKKPHKHLLTLLLRYPQSKHPQVLNLGGRGSKLWLGEWIFHGSGSSLP